MIGTFVRTAILTVFWAALQGSFSPGNLVFGVLLSYAIVRFSRPLFDGSEPTERISTSVRPLRRLWRFFVMVLVFLRELVVSSLQVAKITVQPSLDIRSGIIKYPLDVTTDREITALSNLITLTPGTMTLDVSRDRSHLYVHTMNVETEGGEEVIADIKGTLEKHVHRGLGPVGPRA
jgi:multicomponent Na+:H+ antiporter subunit E